MIGNEVVDQYAKWGAALGAVSPEEIAEQELRDQVTCPVQHRLLSISMAVTKADPSNTFKRNAKEYRWKKLTVFQQ